jgi:hypothetical protein
MKVHPAADIFPMMPDEELQALAEDINTSGLLEPIKIIKVDGENVLIDGRNRLMACAMAGVPPTFEQIEVADPYAYVVSLNVKRRNLTAGQKAIAAAEAWIAAEKEGRTVTSGKVGRGRSAKVANLIQDPRSYFAKLFGSNHNSIRQARELIEQDPPAAAEVKNGGPRTLAAAYADLEKRIGTAANERARQRTLAAARPDLAEKVANGTLSLASAEAEVEAEEKERKSRRWAATMNVIDGVRLLKRPVEHAEQNAADYDQVQAEARGEKVTASDLREVAAYVSALADHFSAKE